MIHRPAVFAAGALALVLSGCGGGAGVSSTPTPVVAPTTPITPTTAIPPLVPNTTNFDTAEYRRSNGAVAAQPIAAWQAGASGAGIIAGVIDSGVASANSEFAGRISPLSRDVAGSRSIDDEDGHGTEVAAVLLAARDGAAIQGIAFQATLLALRTDRPGSCAETTGCAFDSSAIAAGFDVAATARARVVNVSLGGGTATGGVRAAAARASVAGAVLVISAGNDGKPEVDSFASDVHSATPGTVIVAGAFDETRTIGSFSNRAGAAADYYLTALGSRVRSFDNTGAAFLYTGTSEAAPLISGAAVLLAQAYPTLTPAQIVDILLRTADDLGDTGTDAIYGRGALNITRAFAPIGALTVAKVADPLTVTTSGILGSPLGDASQFGMALSKVPVHDSYGRPYSVNLGSMLRAQAPGRLANALLGADISNGGARFGAADIAMSFSGVDGANWRGEVATGVDWRDRPRGAFLGGQAQVQLAPGRSMVLGYGQSASAMLDSASGSRNIIQPFVAARATESGLVAQPLGGAAFAGRWGAWSIGTAFGQQAINFGRGTAPARSSRALVRADRWLGAVRIGVGVEMLVEQGTLLGSQLPAVFGISGASTTSALVRAEIPFGRWSLAGDARLASVRPALSGRGLVQGDARLLGTALSIALSREAILGDDDRMSLTLAQPLRAAGMVTLVTEAAPVWLGPSGHETVIELDYLRAFDAGSFSLGTFWRDQPGNIATAPADAGVAARLYLRF